MEIPGLAARVQRWPDPLPAREDQRSADASAEVCRRGFRPAGDERPGLRVRHRAQSGVTLLLRDREVRSLAMFRGGVGVVESVVVSPAKSPPTELSIVPFRFGCLQIM